MNDDTPPTSADPLPAEINPAPAVIALETPPADSSGLETAEFLPTAPEPVAVETAPAAPTAEEPAAAEEVKPKKTRTRKVKAKTEDEPNATSAAAPVVASGDSKKHWYVIKVTSNREESIKAAIERRVKIEGLEEFFGQIVIPVERVTQVKKIVEKKKDTGEKVTKEKRVVKEHKKFPGYIFAEVEFNDRILYLFRETSGVGDFVGASLHRAPTPMTDKEVNAMLYSIVDPKDKKGLAGKTVVKLDYEKGDKVRIREGAFANSEGEVKLITEPKDAGDTPKVTVVVTIWGRPVDVELDYWQVDKV